MGKLASKPSKNRNYLGNCAEQRACNEVLRKDIVHPLALNQVAYTPAYRVRTAQVKPYCINCTEVLGKIMELTEADILNNDFDWFVIINMTPIHVASDGCRLPNYIIRNFDSQIAFRKRIIQLPDIIEATTIKVNPELPNLTGILQYQSEYSHIVETYDIFRGHKLEQDEFKVTHYDIEFNFNDEFIGSNHMPVLREYLIKLYVPAFLKFGVKGFLSLDHTIGENTDETFHWVVSPDTCITQDILELGLPSITLANDDSIDTLYGNEIDIVSLVNKYLN